MDIQNKEIQINKQKNLQKEYQQSLNKSTKDKKLYNIFILLKNYSILL